MGYNAPRLVKTGRSLPRKQRLEVVSQGGFVHRRRVIREPHNRLRLAIAAPGRDRRASRAISAGQSLTEYRRFALHGLLLVLPVLAVLTAMADRVTDASTALVLGGFTPSTTQSVNTFWLDSL